MNALRLFREADWKIIQYQLTRYAVMKVQKLRWRTAEGLPRGVLPEDLALGAIQKTYEGLAASGASGRGVRHWDPGKEPDLLEFLKAVVDSDVSSLVNLEEHRLTNYSAELTTEDAAEALQSSIDTRRAGDHSSDSLARGDAETQLARGQEASEEKRLFESLMEALHSACANDPDEVAVLRACEQLAEEEENIKPAAIARIAGLDEDRVRNARRRIERKTRMIRTQLMTRRTGHDEKLRQTGT